MSTARAILLAALLVVLAWFFRYTPTTQCGGSVASRSTALFGSEGTECLLLDRWTGRIVLRVVSGYTLRPYDGKWHAQPDSTPEP